MYMLFHQDVPVSTGQVENYVLLLVLLSAFAGGMLVLLSLLLLFCHRCCMGGRRYSRCVACLSSLQNAKEDYRNQCVCGERRIKAAYEYQTESPNLLPPFRASDDLEKTNTTYAEDSQPTQGKSCVRTNVNMYPGPRCSLHCLLLLVCLSEITIHLDESDALSAASCHDGESERFVSTGSTGRRVSFNESALYEKEKTTQDKARRYCSTMRINSCSKSSSD